MISYEMPQRSCQKFSAMENNPVQSNWDVKHLLKQWKLENILSHLIAEEINGEILQMIKMPHIPKLLGNFPLGVQIRFEYNLEQWRYSIGRPLCGHKCDKTDEHTATTKVLRKNSQYANHNTPPETPTRSSENNSHSENEDLIPTDSNVVMDSDEHLETSAPYSCDDPKVVQDTELSIPTAYRLYSEVVSIKTPVTYEAFLNKACRAYRITDIEDYYLTVNDCEIGEIEFESIIRQYYKLPTLVVEVKQRSSLISELDISANDINSTLTEDTNVPSTTMDNYLPNAKDIRNIAAIRHIVLLTNTSNPMQNKHRTTIAKAVIDECLGQQPDRILKRQDYLTLAHNICEAFPGEEPGIYYTPCQPNHPTRGKLWSSFKNKRNFLNKTGVLKTRPLKRRKLDRSDEIDNDNANDSENVTDEAEDELYAQEIQALDFTENSLFDFEYLKQMWRETHEQRWQQLQAKTLAPLQYLEKYSILKGLRGISLMEIDVKMRHPTVASVENWYPLYAKVVERVQMKRLSVKVRKAIENIEQSTDERYRASLALQLIPYIFTHNGRKIEMSGEKGTKLEIQQHFVKEYTCLDDLRSDTVAEDLQLRFVHTDHRIIYAEFSIEGFIFKCSDLLEALNCLFYYMQGLNIKYPPTCSHIWQFVQFAIFQIELTGVKWPNVESIISDLTLS